MRFRRRRDIALAMLFVLMLMQPVEAKKITIAQDGSGDATTFADAMTMASPRDTLWVKSGVYTEHGPFEHQYGTFDAYVAVTVDSLTIIGEDRDAVIIGPESAHFEGQDPRGVALPEEGALVLQNLTIRNVAEGLHLFGAGDVDNIRIVECKTGAIVLATDQTRFSRIHAERSVPLHRSTGILIARSSRSIEVTDAVVVGWHWGVTDVGSEGLRIENSKFFRCNTGLQVQLPATNASVYSSQFEGSLSASVYCTANDLLVDACGFAPVGPTTIRVSSGGVTIRDSVLRSGQSNTIQSSSGRRIDITGSHIEVDPLNAKSIWLVEETYGFPETLELDMRNNYWFGLTQEQVEASIWDINDDPIINARVLVDPVFSEPVAGSTQSIGGIKARVRGGGRR